jgi:hypothetical protein
VESSCKLGNEPLGSIKCWELSNGCTTFGLSSGTQLHRISQLVTEIWYFILVWTTQRYGNCIQSPEKMSKSE